MSKFLSSAASQEFDDMVHQEFQGVGKIRDTVTLRNNVVGDTYNFRRMGQGLANQKSTADEVTPMDVTHDLIPAVLENWNAPEYTDIFDQAEVNFDEKRELARSIAMALGRRLDQIVIDALEASTPATTTVPAGGTGLTVAKLSAAATALTDFGVPGGNRTILITAAGLEDLLADEEATSIDFNNVRALVSGELDTYVGFKIKVIETRVEGGLVTTAGDITQAWAYHRDAVGLAIGIDLKTSVDWIAQRTAWLSNGMMKAGAAVRDPRGIIQVDYDNSP
jgi:hypothetical protein